ncbi:hypothetical protein [Leptospira interrogans]|uniref:hypothetical protein n=1 Tax=Leptospira interrogans TaxID=173 RepID=UPI00046C51A5|nr:hypothetical protein [Leptospira interrogans]
MERKVLTSPSCDIQHPIRGQLCEVATHGFAVADLDSSMDRGLSPKRAINLPPAFLTPSIQEYHIRNCLTFKKHTNLWIALENSTQRFPMGRVVGRELSFTEDFVVIPTDLY